MGRCREVQGLVHAEWMDVPPWGENKGRTVQQRRGLAYERKFGEHLQRMKKPGDALLLGGPWIKFWDQNGVGFAQPDFLLVSPRGVYIFECKLKENSKAWVQLFRLYGPLVEYLLRRPIKRVQVCKYLRPLGTNSPARCPVINSAKELKDECIWNWLGK